MHNPEIVIVPTFFITCGYVVWVLANTAQRRHRLKLMTDFHTKLIDKLGSVKDFGDFLQTDAGARFMKDLASEPVLVGGPHDRILRAVQLGAVLGCLGLGLLVMTFFAPGLDGWEAFTALGVISLALGVGFVVSAAASYKLSGVMGLLAPHANQSNTAAVSEG